ncbi:hypothetical protein ABOM_001505 [Aspergillus bombycis]|uniref:NmrA-like domain-containing protein n=1 Tax=Aspergillus bombycis TaxID=109264 RepID=A0A1F8ADX1_9EURO|nr:hypothetical protein ABOM_001505 [Aspergillus bombycis]OGM49914.1 hypothetical protein ABOM_001505 [Aspergillus bombycis]
MPTYDNVVIFGASGAVGSAAALRAHTDGAKVSLAMRDTSKSVTNLHGFPFERFQADLTQPDTIKAAVCRTGAKAAFIYAVFGAPDHMRPAIRALKESGIEFVVFLSSFTIMTTIRAVPSADVIAHHHAQIEIVLEEELGPESFVAVRPSYFASNVLQHSIGIKKGEVRLPNPDAVFDFISPNDIGTVAGALLTSGQRVRMVGLLGPERLSLRDAIGIVGTALGKTITVMGISEDEAVTQMVKSGISPSLVKWVVQNVVHRPHYFFENPDASTAIDNIQKYSSNTPERFQQWVENNKDRF